MQRGDKSRIYREIARLLAMIAGWLDEDKVNQEILVFVGRQGIFKTTWFGHLLPPQLQAVAVTASEIFDTNDTIF